MPIVNRYERGLEIMVHQSISLVLPQEGQLQTTYYYLPEQKSFCTSITNNAVVLLEDVMWSAHVTNKASQFERVN